MLFWTELATLVGLKIENCPNMAGKTPGTGGHNVYSITGANCNTARAYYGEAKTNHIFAAAVNPTNSSLGNAFWIMSCVPQYTFNCVTTFEQKEVLAYDNKVDNGLPGSGSVIAGTKATATYLNWTYTFPTSYDPNSTSKMAIIEDFANNL